jgi:hypothetical protein
VAWTLELELDDLAGSRFAVSPLHETISALQLLAAPSRQSVHAPWSRRTAAELTDRPLSLPLLEQLVVHGRPSWPEFLAPAPASRHSSLDAQLAAVQATDPADVRASIRRVFSNQPPPAARRLTHDTDTALADVAAELRGAHDRLIAPHWPRMLALLEVDIAHRAAQLAARGPAALLDQLHPAISWNAGKLTIGQPREVRRIHLGAGGLVLCPSVFGGPDVAVKHRTSSQTTLRYPARGLGTLWTATTEAPSSALDQLVGRPRARLLRAVTSPATTTLLAREQAVTASAVSQHLTVLYANGLVDRHRTGRHVHYVLSQNGRALVRSAGPDTEAP